MAHEIRNPLSSIKGFATISGSDTGTIPRTENGRIMIQEVDRLNRVISQLLDYARPMTDAEAGNHLSRTSSGMRCE